MTNIEVTYVVTVKVTVPLEAYGGDSAEEARAYEYSLDMEDKLQNIVEALSLGSDGVDLATTVRIVEDA